MKNSRSAPVPAAHTRSRKITSSVLGRICPFDTPPEGTGCEFPPLVDGTEVVIPLTPRG
jgi:hypothetical protein